MIAFTLANTQHGSLLVNRLDYNYAFNGSPYGVGAQLLETGSYDAPDVGMLKELLKVRRAHFGDGVVALDVGANIGVHSVEWANLMKGWGYVVAIEAQERIFYALAGNLTLHNAFNARAIWAAVDEAPGEIAIPEPDYTKQGSFGSFELKGNMGTEFIGQPVDYGNPTLNVQAITLDSLCLPRVDLIKMDVEGMESEALRGAAGILETCKPIVFVETIKSDGEALKAYLEGFGYHVMPNGMNALAIHKDDPSLQNVTVEKADEQLNHR